MGRKNRAVPLKLESNTSVINGKRMKVLELDLPVAEVLVPVERSAKSNKHQFVKVPFQCKLVGYDDLFEPIDSNRSRTSLCSVSSCCSGSRSRGAGDSSRPSSRGSIFGSFRRSRSRNSITTSVDSRPSNISFSESGPTSDTDSRCSVASSPCVPNDRKSLSRERKERKREEKRRRKEEKRRRKEEKRRQKKEKKRDKKQRKQEKAKWKCCGKKGRKKPRVTSSEAKRGDGVGRDGGGGGYICTRRNRCFPVGADETCTCKCSECCCNQMRPNSAGGAGLWPQGDSYDSGPPSRYGSTPSMDGGMPDDGRCQSVTSLPPDAGRPKRKKSKGCCGSKKGRRKKPETPGSRGSTPSMSSERPSRDTIGSVDSGSGVSLPPNAYGRRRQCMKNNIFAGTQTRSGGNVENSCTYEEDLVPPVISKDGEQVPRGKCFMKRCGGNKIFPRRKGESKFDKNERKRAKREKKLADRESRASMKAAKRAQKKAEKERKRQLRDERKAAKKAGKGRGQSPYDDDLKKLLAAQEEKCRQRLAEQEARCRQQLAEQQVKTLSVQEPKDCDLQDALRQAEFAAKQAQEEARVAAQNAKVAKKREKEIRKMSKKKKGKPSSAGSNYPSSSCPQSQTSVSGRSSPDGWGSVYGNGRLSSPSSRSSRSSIGPSGRPSVTSGNEPGASGDEYQPGGPAKDGGQRKSLFARLCKKKKGGTPKSKRSRSRSRSTSPRPSRSSDIGRPSGTSLVSNGSEYRESRTSMTSPSSGTSLGSDQGYGSGRRPVSKPGLFMSLRNMIFPCGSSCGGPKSVDMCKVNGTFCVVGDIESGRIDLFVDDKSKRKLKKALQELGRRTEEYAQTKEGIKNSQFQKY